MSEPHNCWRRASVFMCLVGCFVLFSHVSYAQQKPIVEELGNLQSTTTGVYKSGSYTVPDGQTLVIEQLFIEMHVPAGVKATGKIVVSAVTPTSLSNKRYPFIFTAQGTDTGGKSILTASNLMKLYVINRTDDPATISVRLEVKPQSSGTSSGDYITISGYLQPTAP